MAQQEAKQRVTWTFVPADDVESLMDKAITREIGKKLSRNKKARRGIRTRLINEAIQNYFAGLAGKREAQK